MDEHDQGEHAKGPAQQLPGVDDALALLLMDTRELMETMMSLLDAGQLRPGARRNLLHLYARMDGLTWQVEEAMQLSERLVRQARVERGRHRGRATDRT